ncbi:MAG: type II secretion system protein M [Caulobacterales bacterium]|nr:type II secretion system protein M [Caulobacterales bacterium]
MTARAQAERSYVDAAAMLDEVRAGAAQARAAQLTAETGGGARGSLRGAVAETAKQFGLQINRVQPLETGEISVAIDEAEPTAMLGWMMALRGEHGVAVKKATIRRHADGASVRATLLLAAVSVP